MLLAYYFPPLGGAGSLRLLSFAKYLPAFGWQPVVVTVGDLGTVGQDSSVLAALDRSVAVHRWYTPLAGRWALRRKSEPKPGAPPRMPNDVRSRTGASRTWRSRLRPIAEQLLATPDHAMGWSLAAGYRAGRFIRETGIAAIVTSSPPHSELAAGRIAKAISGAAWIADLRDPWASGDRGTSRTLRDRCGRWLEAGAVHHADRVLANTERFADSLRSAHPRFSGRIEVLPNGYDAAPIAAARTTVREAGRDGSYVILHSGTLYDGFREPFGILEAMARVKRELRLGAGRIRLVLAGESGYHHRAELRERIRALGLTDDVEFPGYLAHQRALELMAGADLLLLIQGGTTVDASIPSKAFEYLALGRPVLALTTPGATADLVRRSPLGEVLDPDDVDAITACLIRGLRGEKREPDAPPPEGVYSREQLAGRLATILDQAVAAGGQ